MTPQPAIEIRDLTVAYRDKPVLWDVDLEVPSGVLMAIVGPNGAGKTTLIKATLGLVQPAAGEILVNGGSHAEQRRSVAYVPQRGMGDRVAEQTLPAQNRIGAEGPANDPQNGGAQRNRSEGEIQFERQVHSTAARSRR